MTGRSERKNGSARPGGGGRYRFLYLPESVGGYVQEVRRAEQIGGVGEREVLQGHRSVLIPQRNGGRNRINRAVRKISQAQVGRIGAGNAVGYRSVIRGGQKRDGIPERLPPRAVRLAETVGDKRVGKVGCGSSAKARGGENQPLGGRVRRYKPVGKDRQQIPERPYRRAWACMSPWNVRPRQNPRSERRSSRNPDNCSCPRPDP